MNSFQFRPSLESMDERIVPDAAPIGAPGPQPVAAAAPAPAAPPDSGSDEALRERIGVIDKQLAALAKQDKALAEQFANAQEAFNQALAAGNIALAQAAVAVMNNINAQRQAIADKIKSLTNEKAEMLKWLDTSPISTDLSTPQANAAA